MRSGSLLHTTLVLSLLVIPTLVGAEDLWKVYRYSAQNTELTWVIRDNGDVYFKRRELFSAAPIFSGNFWQGGAVPSATIDYFEIDHVSSDIVVAVWVVLTNGDVYWRTADVANGGGIFPMSPPDYLGNFWSGSVSISPGTWGGAKAKFK